METQKTKTYFCRKASYGGHPCGETDPIKFPPGRYSECKECKNRYTRNYAAIKKGDEMDKKISKLDSDVTIRAVVEDTILRVPLVNGTSVPEMFKRGEEIHSELYMELKNKLEIAMGHISVLYSSIKVLNGELDLMKKEKENLKNNFTNKEDEKESLDSSN
jgi:hypothetical protein